MRMPGHRFAFGFFAAVIFLWFAVMMVIMRHSALPASATGTMMVVFEPGTTQDQAFATIVRAGARPIRETSFGFIWVVNGEAGKLISEGALGTYRELPISPLVAGCVAVADAKASEAFGL
ncbi:MAG: hypothetical protein JNM45_12720 [Rhizobiales bacterium]|nr:hypothetical protein [Hyphomicrobiales bacterium]